MATTLDVVNACLDTLGETPLNSLTEPHTFRGTALRHLAKASQKVQARGWWYNREAVTLNPDPDLGQITLAGDCLKWQSGVRSTDVLVRGQPKPWIVQRGKRLYDTRVGAYEITEQVVGLIVREIPFDDLPPVMADYIMAEAVFRFQSSFDGDNGKRTELSQNLKETKDQAISEEIRQASVNLINNNYRLSRIKRVTRVLRY